MKDYVAFLITPLLSVPDALEVTVGPSVVTIKIDQADMGRVIGKQGNNISALRTLIRTYCTLHQIPPVSLTLAEVQKDQ
jgi:predicted RNA-binding protein YlqC (UPF0109 family)